VKSDVRLPLLYGAIIGALLVYRLAASVRSKAAAGSRMRPTRAVESNT
jgi:hypothetical protein